MKEEGVQMNEETQATQSVQESTPQSQDESVDYKALYLAEIQGHKKTRKRAQDAEETVQKNAKAQKALEVKQMQEQEKYKELWEEAAPKAEKYDAYKTARKEALLSKLPEEDRESMSSKDLDTLEYIVKIKEESKPVNPQHQASAPRKVSLDKPYDQMNEQERRAWHEDTMKNYR
tara:strand:- start:506 stop:1030 length:525 start_codon:yes stop_codon:yes gene_type:complete